LENQPRNYILSIQFQIWEDKK